MTWFKVDDHFHDHPKIEASGNAALGLWVRAGSWSMGNLTDGLIPRHMLRRFGTTIQAGRLVESGLWVERSDGWEFHDWADWQELRAEIEERRGSRAAARRRQRQQLTVIAGGAPHESA